MNGGPNASAMAAADIAAITELRAKNMTAILGTPGNVLTFGQQKMQPGYTQRWQEYWRLVQPHAAGILALYPFDEPTAAQMEIYSVCVKLIKASAPTIPIAAVVTPSSVLGIEFGGYALPPEVDWIGFDNCELPLPPPPRSNCGSICGALAASIHVLHADEKALPAMAA